MDEQWPVEAGSRTITLGAYAGRPGPVVIVWPALGVPARFYRPLAEPFADRGLNPVLADYPGQGESKPLGQGAGPIAERIAQMS